MKLVYIRKMIKPLYIRKRITLLYVIKMEVSQPALCNMCLEFDGRWCIPPFQLLPLVEWRPESWTQCLVVWQFISLLCLLVWHIRFPHMSVVIHTTVHWSNQHVANSFKFALAINQTNNHQFTNYASKDNKFTDHASIDFESINHEFVTMNSFTVNLLTINIAVLKLQIMNLLNMNLLTMNLLTKNLLTMNLLIMNSNLLPWVY